MGFGLIQPWHLILILLIVLIVFGAGKLGQVGGALGQSVREFKHTVNDGEEDDASRAVATEPVVKAETRTAPVARPAERPAEPLRREEI